MLPHCGGRTSSDHPRIDSIDEPAIRAFRAERIRQELRRQDREAVLVVDPVNLRYATGTRNMQVIYDGRFEANMIVSVESYVGALDGPDGVKLEQPVLIAEDGPEVLSELSLDTADF